MEKLLPKSYLRKIWRAIIEFDMLAEGDKCLLGLSGGKDSAFLLYALVILREKAPFSFDLAAVTLDPGFTENFPGERLAKLCTDLEVPFRLEKVNLAEVAFSPSQQNPCPRCAFFRRGALNRLAKEGGYNKLALAHHHDDAVETFLLSLLYSGQLKTFGPTTAQDRSGVEVIRPLIYLRESEVRAAYRFFAWEPIKSDCPLDGNNTRQKVKELIRDLNHDHRSVYDNLSAAMRLPLAKIELWPAELSKQDLRDKYVSSLSAGKNLTEQD